MNKDLSEILRPTEELLNLQRAFRKISRFFSSEDRDYESLVSVYEEIDGALISCGYLMQTEPKKGYTKEEIEGRWNTLMHFMILVNIFLDSRDPFGEHMRKFRESPWARQLRDRDYFESVLEREGGLDKKEREGLYEILFG